MASNNYREYFQKQAKDFASWAEFSTPESFIGKAINKDADAYEYFLSPRYYNHYTILFLGYFEQEHTHPLSFPESVLPGQAPPGRGLFYAFEEGRTGVLDVIRGLYPEGIEEPIVGTNGVTVVTFYRVPASAVDAKRGLSERTDSAETAVHSFPTKFPAGPFHGVLTGSLYIDQAADYRFTTRCNGRVSWWISGKAVTDQASFHLIKGFHAVKFKLDTDGDPSLEMTANFPGGRTLSLDSKRFSTISPSRGLKAFFYNSQDCTGEAAMILWDPVINYVNGNDFPYHGGSAHWTGTLRVPQNGEYRFLAQTNDEGGLKIDHREVIPLKSNGSGSIFLTKGIHALDVYYSRPGNGWSNFTLLWSQPQNPRMEVLPNRVFGEVQ
jgi:hypothetical protein